MRETYEGVFEHAQTLLIESSSTPLTLFIMSDRPRKLAVELKDAVLAVKDVTEWHDLGLQLGLPEAKLKSIAAHPDIKGHLRMMLSEWLSYDPEASWEKLAKALDAIDKRVVAENIRRQFLGAVAAAAQNLDDEPETRK